MKFKSLLLFAAMIAAGNAWADDMTISSAEDWNAFCNESATYSAGNITLGADIEVTKMFADTFTGTLDGQGHTITYNVNSPGDFALLKSTGSGAVVKNLNIAGNVKGYAKVGGVAINVNGETTIENVKISADLTSSSYPMSGFVVNGNQKVNMTGCEYSGKLWCTASASADAAGFISRVTGSGAFSFTDCVFSGVVSEERADGSVAGWRAAGFISTVENIAAAEDCYFTGCVVSGEILQANGSERMAGFVGSPNDTKVSYIMKSCLMSGKAIRWTSNDNKTWMAQQNCPIFGCGNWKNLGSNTSAKDCYMTSNAEINAAEVNGFVKVDDSTIASGALCFSLNGDQSDIHFYQTLGVDAEPVPNSTHGQVYASGRKHCDGTDYENVTYNNIGGETEQDVHNFVNDVCDYCHSLNISEDGYFHAVSQEAWEAAVAAIEKGNLKLNVKLECDIVQPRTIKDGYCGILDGQGHSIDVTMGAEDRTDVSIGSGKVSMFGNIGAATIRNCVFVGDMIGSAASAPIANYNIGVVNIENVVSMVNMTQTTLQDGNFSGMLSTANATVHFKNCVVAGRIAATKDAGGFIGWAGGQEITMDNCLMIGDVTVTQGASSVFLRIRHTDCRIKLNNCYYLPCTPHILNGNNSEMAATAKVIEDEDMLASGALCYMMNGDQSEINFYQNLDEDDIPFPFNNHAQVYASGRKHCDGSDYAGVSYNNVGGETTVDEHDYVDNVCSFCSKIQVDSEGIFHIVSAEGFAAFAKAVKTGNTTLNAVMDDDVAVNIGGEDCPLINNYAGTFDGQGHTIDATVVGSGSWTGIFASTKKATIRNVVAKGSASNGDQVGFIGMNNGDDLLLENIIVDMDIQGTANVAGIVGCFDACSGKTITFRNVMFKGNVKYVGALNGNGSGGFLAWSGSGATYILENCAMIGDVDITNFPQKTAQFVRANNGCTFKMTNCAYIPVPNLMFVNGHSSEANANAAIVENASDGSLCWALNGESFQNPVWFQTLDEDYEPVLDNTHGIVYPYIGGYASNTADEYDQIATNLVAESADFADTDVHPAQKSVVETYTEAVEELESVSSFEELVATYYPTINDLRAAVAKSQKAYDKLVTKVEDTRQYLENNADQFKGYECYQKLETYLSDEYIDPAEDEYPNGSYSYIVDAENLLLDEAGIEEEIKFIDKMILDALNEGLNPGADATQFIANADFSKGFESWEGAMSTVAQSTSYPGKYIVESWSNKPYDMHQTITVPENGIYELTINGAYRINELGNSHQSSAMVYLNDNETYLQASVEGMVDVEDAQDKVNAWITGDVADYKLTDDFGDVIGYTTHGQQGAACAFFNENPRYENRIIANVTDHKLTVGVRNEHLLTSVNEWTTIGNIKLTYLGTLEEADEAMDATLASMKARAEFVLDQDPNSEPSDEAIYYPNYYKSLKAALADKVAAIDEAASAEDKYALVQELGDLFQEILECKANYRSLLLTNDALMAAIDGLASTLTEEEVEATMQAIMDNQNAYLDGAFTSEEAANGGYLAGSSVYPKYNENGAMEITNGANLSVFAALVNNGLGTGDAVLVNDIDVDSNTLMIGKTAYPYSGVFDGQGHTINADIDRSGEDAVGIFHVTGNCTIKNLRVAGEIYGKSNTGAFVGQVSGKTNFQNVVSSANVIGLSNVGGFAGNTVGSQMTWQDCLWDGKVRATDQGAGGYVGWSSDNTMTARNCVSIGEVEGRQLAYMFRVKCTGTVGDAAAAGCKIDAQNIYVCKTGCIDKEVNAEVICNGTPLWWGEFLIDETKVVSAEDMASGKICYELNNGNTDEPAWRQDLTVDAYPMLLTNHSVVFLGESGYTNNNLDDEDAIQEVEAAQQMAGSAIYNLSGQRVSKAQKGLYIIGGKKYLVK